MIPRCILILGPTAGGKTTLSIDLAAALPGGGHCLCADSMQVYRGMDIGTAKPTADEQARAPHHLINIADPSDGEFSVDRWLQDANDTVDTLLAEQLWPIVVGGTNLYIQAFLFGLFDGPAPDPALRDSLNQQDLATLRQTLETVDPVAAQRIHPNDRKRTVRAIEVFEKTGTPISTLQQQWEANQTTRDVLIIGLEWPVDAINRRINARVKQMIEQGLVEETQRLEGVGAFGLQAREALGYRQILEHLAGRATLDEAIEEIKIRTRRFAKQQRTWLRRFRQHQPALWIDPSAMSPQDLVNKCLTFIRDRA